MAISQTIVTGSVVLASFLGGLVAVFVGQFLAFYRSEREHFEELLYLVTVVGELEDKTTPYTTHPDDLSEIQNEMKELHLRTKWAFDQDTNLILRDLILSLEQLKVNAKKSTRYEGEVDLDPTQRRDFQNKLAEEEEAVEYASIVANIIKEEMSRIPFRKFLPRYFGYIST